MRQALAQMKKPRFALNPQSDAADARLIVLDEVSMVGEEMARDLMSFGKPILVLGDPGQLPPIKGEGAFTRDAPDVMLTEIHRQAAESAIIRLATMARQGEPIGFGEYDTLRLEDAQEGRDAGAGAARRAADLRHERDPAAAQQRHAPCRGLRRRLAADRARREDHLPEEPERPRADQRHVRHARGRRRRGQPLLLGRGEGRGRQPHRPPGRRRRRGRLRIYKGHFEDHVAFDRKRHDRDWKEKRHADRGDLRLGDHRATRRRGRNGRTSIVWDDGLGRSELDRRRWLYTAITRAEQGLVILA